MDLLEKRIQHLEKASRIHRLAIGALVILLCAAAAYEYWRPWGVDVQARRVSILDERGRARVQLGSLGHELYGVSFADSSGKARALLELQKDGTPRLSFANPNGQSLAELTVFQDAPRLSLANAEGVEFFSLSQEMDGSSRMSLLDQNGRSRVTLGATGDGSLGLALVDRYGRALAELTVSANSSRLVLQGRDGSVFKAPAECQAAANACNQGVGAKTLIQVQCPLAQ